VSGIGHNGGPAFPIETTSTPYAPGMSLRDWFAAHWTVDAEAISVAVAEELMGSIMPNGVGSLSARIKWFAEAEARYRYLCADAMLAAREAAQ